LASAAQGVLLPGWRETLAPAWAASPAQACQERLLFQIEPMQEMQAWLRPGRWADPPPASARLPAAVMRGI